MKLFGKRDAAPSETTAGDSRPATPGQTDEVQGERTVPSINRARSLQSRVSSILALGLMGAIGIGLLGWYYSHAWNRSARAQTAAESAARDRAKTEMALPPLGPVEPPRPPTAKNEVLEKVLGPAPDDPDVAAGAAWHRADALMAAAPPPVASATRTPGSLAFERRLGGAVFARQTRAGVASAPQPSQSSGLIAGSAPTTELSSLLVPSATPAVEARVLPTRELLLGKGTSLDCTLETAIDSTLPGMTTCITATDAFGLDGRVVLLERGTKLVGETRGQVQQGAARLFVVWSEARTPSGVVVPLASPGTDELGRSGLPGTVDRHFWDRFGAAILLSVIDGAIQGAAQSSGRGDTVILNPSASDQVMTEVLKSTIAIRPTVRKAQGDRVQVLVARDVDFRSVYTLRTAASAAGAP